MHVFLAHCFHLSLPSTLSTHPSLALWLEGPVGYHAFPQVGGTQHSRIDSPRWGDHLRHSILGREGRAPLLRMNSMRRAWWSPLPRREPVGHLLDAHNSPGKHRQRGLSHCPSTVLVPTGWRPGTPQPGVREEKTRTCLAWWMLHRLMVKPSRVRLELLYLLWLLPEMKKRVSGPFLIGKGQLPGVSGGCL